jgi:hypothetical protein
VISALRPLHTQVPSGELLNALGHAVQRAEGRCGSGRPGDGRGATFTWPTAVGTADDVIADG